MLAIRMQRTGRKGHAMFRVVVQDSRRTPSSGRVVALLGSYDPHTKAVQLSKDKADFYLKNGAQPSERVVRLFQSEGVTLPSWIKTASTDRTRGTRNPEKLRKNQPKQESAPVEAEAKTEETANE
jgi:small subunit ribosomal protein S16